MSDTVQAIVFGSYICNRCKKDYIVNDGTWRLCTPEFCHDCLEHLEKQYARVPVDKDGKDLAQ